MGKKGLLGLKSGSNGYNKCPFLGDICNGDTLEQVEQSCKFWDEFNKVGKVCNKAALILALQNEYFIEASDDKYTKTYRIKHKNKR